MEEIITNYAKFVREGEFYTAHVQGAVCKGRIGLSFDTDPPCEKSLNVVYDMFSDFGAFTERIRNFVYDELSQEDPTICNDEKAFKAGVTPYFIMLETEGCVPTDDGGFGPLFPVCICCSIFGTCRPISIYVYAKSATEPIECKIINDNDPKIADVDTAELTAQLLQSGHINEQEVVRLVQELVSQQDGPLLEEAERITSRIIIGGLMTEEEFANILEGLPTIEELSDE